MLALLKVSEANLSSGLDTSTDQLLIVLDICPKRNSRVLPLVTFIPEGTYATGLRYHAAMRIFDLKAAVRAVYT